MGDQSPPNHEPASSASLEVLAQRASNRSAVSHFDSFAQHCARLTAVVVSAVLPEDGRTLCVLGAGNCYDLDLDRIADVYREIHLVDIDDEALQLARERQTSRVRERLFCHAPVDLSGLVEKLDRWKQMKVTPEEVMNQPDAAAKHIASQLPAPFDVVLSACLLTQLQLVALNVLSSSHQLFEAVRQIVSLTHLRTLARLTKPGGRAILATDFVSNQTYPLQTVDPSSDLEALMTELLSAGNCIYAAHPGLLAWMGSEDPVLRRTLRMSAPHDPWLWHNGPELIFLVYAMEMQRLP